LSRIIESEEFPFFRDFDWLTAMKILCFGHFCFCFGSSHFFSAFSHCAIFLVSFVVRRLVDMLSENEQVISFYPGLVQNGQVTLGRIVVHDRSKVEADILPRYFNHSSFASLRRQLNYFSFCRMGKGRQRGATYCNDAVVDLADILRLKRRSTTANISSSSSSSSNESLADSSQESPAEIQTSSSPSPSSSDDIIRSSKPQNKRARHNTKKPTPTLVSPSMSPVSHKSEDEPRIMLDLTTVPSNRKDYLSSSCSSWKSLYAPKLAFDGDDDILAGCKALLSFSKGSHFGGKIGSAV
jgi:hypothetical protein